jgi:hypothetical protein
MTASRHFLTDVVKPNVDEFLKAFWHERSAVNAIVTFDCLLGALFVELKAAGQINDADDTIFRDRLASTDGNIQLVRDAAFALKHGELKHNKPRLVRRSDQIGGKVPTLSDGFFVDHDFLDGSVIMIEKEERVQH